MDRCLARVNDAILCGRNPELPMHKPTTLRATFALVLALAAAVAGAATDPRDLALLARMTLEEKVNQLMLLSKGTMTGPDSAGRPTSPSEELARKGIGFQMSAFE